MTSMEAEKLLYKELKECGYPVYRAQAVPSNMVRDTHVVVKASAWSEGMGWDIHTVYALGYVPFLRDGIMDKVGVEAMENTLSEPYLHKTKVLREGDGTITLLVGERFVGQVEQDIDCYLVSMMFYLKYRNYKF